jgi:membrane protein implicated in regulation of membrane protease activity
MPKWDRIRDERISMYFDIILGIIMSSFTLFGIFFFSLTEGIEYFSVFYVLGVVFWISWLIFSIVLMVIGIKSYLDNKYFEKTGKPKKARKIRAPMVS